MKRPLAVFAFSAVETCGFSWLACLIVSWPWSQGMPTIFRLAVGGFFTLHSAYLAYRHQTWVFLLGGLFGFLFYTLSIILFVHYHTAR